MKDPILKRQATPSRHNLYRKVSVAYDMIKSITNSVEISVLKCVRINGRISHRQIERLLRGSADYQQPQISFAVANLTIAGVIKTERDGNQVFCTVVPEQIAKINRICAELADGYNAKATVMDQVECAEVCYKTC